ncbi:acetyltransferase [Shewanella psychrotolerans]|uniref:acetyltransferase n=1 Tax=Shewanella psychrotolerans TaxID=2864206 RepID=UPI001C658093|nr:acetyltransferase [Shewanella psychrotolerans]QYK00269.1 acetyltransferase [Shewanella psychrotolerans]
MSKLAIFGASGHGKVIAEIAELNGWSEIVFFDDAWPSITQLEGWRVNGDSDMLISSLHEFGAFFVAIGNNAIRLDKHITFELAGGKAISLIHPSAVVSKYSKLASGTAVMANAVVGAYACVGKAGIINTNCTIDHDCKLEEAVHISPGANLAGGVKIGRCSWIGIGASIIQQIQIDSNVIVGAGSVVINDVMQGLSVVGVPAKSIHI